MNDWSWGTASTISTAALLASLISLYFSARASRLAYRQEQRRKPNFSIALLNASVRTGNQEHPHIYAFNISVSNPSDIDNAIAKLELRLTYLTAAKVEMNIKVGCSDAENSQFLPGVRTALSVPTKVAAHDTASGWCYFPVPFKILENSQVEGYQIVLTDSHNIQSTIEPLIIQEYRDDVPRATS